MKKEVPPPVIPAAEPASPEAPALPVDPAVKTPGAQPLPDDLPVLLDPARPGVIPRRTTTPRRTAAFDPLANLEPESGEEPAEELPSFLQMVEPVAAQPDVAHYLLDDPLARTSLSNILGNGELFYDGFGGIIRPLNVVTLPQRQFEPNRGFRMGPLSLRPGLSGGLIGTRRKEGASREDETTAVIGANVSGLMGSPETGRYLTLDYGVARLFESRKAQDSDLDQSLYLAGHLAFGKLKLGLGIDFASLSGFNRDAGDQVQRDYLTVALTSTLQLTPRTSIDWDIATPNGRYPSGNSFGSTVGDASGFSSTNFVNYEYSAKSTVGLGFTTGFLEIEDQETQKFQRLLARVSSTPTPFLSYSATVGVEFRDTGHKNVTHPILSLSAVWTPRERTVVTLTGEQRIQNSVGSANSNFLSSTFVLSVTQQLGNRFRASLSGGFENAKYESIGIGVSPNRRERSYLGQFSISTTLYDRVDLSASISYVRTISNDSTSYTAQCALQASLLF